MSKQIKQNQGGEPEVNVAEALSKTQLFLKEHGKKVLYIILALVLIIVLIYAYKAFIVTPKHQEAQNQMYVAERNFNEDNFEVALKGDGNVLGFEQIIQKYGNRADKSVYFYAGICELRLGNNDQAINYLKKYKTSDKYTSAAAKANIGDALVNKGDIKGAIQYFEDAANMLDDFYAAKYHLKAAICYEEIGNTSKAIQHYNIIKDKYSQSPEGADIDKYIARASALSK